MNKRIAIDAVTIYAGHGGSGGGIWTYTKNLLQHLDAVAGRLAERYEFYCLANNEFNLPLVHIKVLLINTDTRGLVKRMAYVHLQLPQLCRRYKIDLLHKLTSEVPLSAAPTLVTTVHDFMLEFYAENGYNNKSGALAKLKTSYYTFVTKLGIAKSKSICTPSETIRQEVIKRFGTTPAKVFATPLATQLTKTTTIERRQNTPARFYCIAAFHKHKGHLRCIEIFEHLLEKYGPVSELYFRGNVHDPVFYQHVVNRIKSSKYKNSIHIVPFDKSSPLEEIYSRADFMLLLSDYEGFGLPVLEAQGFGVPVVCSGIPTFKEVAGDSAFYLPQADTAAAADILYNLIADTEAQNELVAKGYANCHNFSWDITAQKTVDVYERCLEQ